MVQKGVSLALFPLQGGVIEFLDPFPTFAGESKLKDAAGKVKNLLNEVAAAKEDLQHLESFLTELRKFFVPIAYPDAKDSREFKLLLNDTLYNLNREAEAANVVLPSKPYPFTFKKQSESTQFEPPTITPLAIQLEEIKTICQILFKAKVHSIEGLRRAPIAKDENDPTDYLVGRTTATSSGCQGTPCEFSLANGCGISRSRASM